MTLPLERARARKPITWLTVIGVILLPVAIGGVLVAALYNPVDRLGNMTAAIVNEDEPVEIDGQAVPLGRQLTAGLVEGSDDLPSNLHWTITNADDAASGLADGTYDAIVTIPEDFSAAATSTAGDDPEQATIQVTTPPDSRIVDDAITAQVTQAAASLTGQELSKAYLQNVLLGFTTLHDQLGTAAGGATRLADGATQAADGAAQLPAGASALGSGASQLSSGAGQLASGAGGLASGLGQLEGAAQGAAGGAGGLADQLGAAASSVADPQLQGAAAASAQYAGTSAAQAQALAGSLGSWYATECASAPTPPAYCTDLQGYVSDATALATSTGTGAAYASGTQTGVDTLMAETSDGLNQASAGARDLQSGLSRIADGIGQSRTGAQQLQTGAQGLQSGAGQLATGADQLATGTESLADGVGQLATGATSLADGLDTAVAQIPDYTDGEAESLASVVANPVGTEGLGTSLFGASAIPLLATLALWFGGLASFLALRAVPARALASRRPSFLLALRAFAPGAAIGAIQGVLVSVVVQVSAAYDAGTWSLFALLCVLAGIAFAAVNQALVAVFGGAGRWIAALAGVLAAATGIVSTVPAWLVWLASLMPTSPAYTAMLGALTSADGVGAAVAVLVIWLVLALLATVLAVTRRRTTTARALLAASPAPA